jgi:hypothetical protein
MMTSSISKPVLVMLIGQLVIALLLFWVLPISKAAEIQETDIKLSLGT